MQSDQLVLGIDGGGSKTVAWLAARSPKDEPTIVGRGTAGPANPQAVGFDAACENLDRAITAAWAEGGATTGIIAQPFAAAVLALAGSDRQENRDVLHRWADDRRLARRFRVVHDALPVLAAGSDEDWGVGLISGTGSLAFGKARDGRSARAGGWGFLFGDEGSGYAVALAGLRAAAQATDGRGPKTTLSEALLARLDIERPEELVRAVYRFADNRRRIASLARVVTAAATRHDPVAVEILQQAARDLAAMVGAVARKLHFAEEAFPLAVAGGLLLGSQELRGHLESELTRMALHPEPIAMVVDPVLGAVKLALNDAAR